MRRRFRPRFGRSWALSVAAALAIVGFVGAAQWNSSVARQTFTTSAQQVLAAQVLELEEEQATLREEIAEAEAQVQQFQEESRSGSATLAELSERLDAARLAAGLTEVRGPGVVIEIADSNRVVPPGENPASFIVLVDDLRDIVTALWASGAEAIAINDERLVATSSIYGVGASILVNTSFLTPPYRIEAIGPEGLLDRFMAHEAFQGRVAQRIEFFGLEFATAAEQELTLPAFVGTTRFRWAVPVEETAG
ncbi:MAG TPA: DUF881 domain-containing protein [candidate division Zixibacteria bacterium]|nr:DUF881 domain-containing protein [candidate division Zixibacteria bacterium]